jgi:hypothetical protein
LDDFVRGFAGKFLIERLEFYAAKVEKMAE